MTTSTARYRAFGNDEQVTGEAVAVQTPVAGLLHRCASGVIDCLVSGIILAVTALTITLALGGTSDAVVRTAVILTLVGSLVGVPVLLETLTRGRTVGKLALGLRTVRDDGGPIRFRHAVMRALVGFVEIWMLTGLPAFITALVNPRGKRLGDLAAGTYVITTRTRTDLAPPPMMPPALAPWARGADIASLPQGLAIGVRQYLTRAGGLSPAAREELGRELGEAVLEWVSPPPPPAPREDVLAAVLAERRARDGLRLEREDALRARIIAPDPLR